MCALSDPGYGDAHLLSDIRLSFDKAADLQKTGAFIGINNQREVIRAFLYVEPLCVPSLTRSPSSMHSSCPPMSHAPSSRHVSHHGRFIAHLLGRTVLVHDLVPHANYPNQTLRDPNIIFDLKDLNRGVPTLREVCHVFYDTP